MKHTPGPWEVKDVNPDAWTRQVWTAEQGGSVMIATTGGIDKEANASLIAAAPEMLACLDGLLGNIDQGYIALSFTDKHVKEFGEPTGKVDPLWQMREIIAKANGKCRKPLQER